MCWVGVARSSPTRPGAPLDLGYGWNSGAGRFASSRYADDVGFLLALIDELVATACVDPARVTLLGESNGGGMVVRAVCDERLTGRVRSGVLVNPAIDEGVMANFHIRSIRRCRCSPPLARSMASWSTTGNARRSSPSRGGSPRQWRLVRVR